jgi:hypothetical protein
VNVRQYARAQQRPIGPLRKLIRAVLHAFGVPVTPFQTSEVALRLYRPVLSARDVNYRLAIEYLDDLKVPKVDIPTPREYPLAALTSTIERVVTDIRIVGEPITEDIRADTRVIEEARKSIEGPIVRQALEPAREMVAALGEDEEKPRYGWARVLVGAYSCSFCAMLASRGPVYTSRAAAKGRGDAPMNVYHTPYINKNGKRVGGFCDCEAVLVYRGRSWEGEAAWLALEKLWEDSTEGYSMGKARNEFRQVWERKVRAGETQIYLPESVQRPDAA